MLKMYWNLVKKIKNTMIKYLITMNILQSITLKKMTLAKLKNILTPLYMPGENMVILNQK